MSELNYENYISIKKRLKKRRHFDFLKTTRYLLNCLVKRL